MTTDRTATERKRRERARKREAGLHEVRGIYLPLELHAKLKRMAEKIKPLGR